MHYRCFQDNLKGCLLVGPDWMFATLESRTPNISLPSLLGPLGLFGPLVLLQNPQTWMQLHSRCKKILGRTRASLASADF
jgi:hypothetical protein